MLFVKEANDLLSDFIARKIRQRVKDPYIADKLIPKDHGFGIRRVPMETDYYEVYNQDTVTLVDIQEAPITRITPTGIETTDRSFELDIIIYATGFDAVVGALNRIDIRGLGGKALKDKWADGPRTYLGLQSVGFPNLFTLVGPHNGASFCNIPRCAEENVEWVTAFIRHLRDNDLTYAEPVQQAEDDWTEHVNDTVKGTLLPTADSWFMGANENIPGRKKTFLLYAGGNQKYRQITEDVAANGYEGFVLR